MSQQTFYPLMNGSFDKCITWSTAPIAVKSLQSLREEFEFCLCIEGYTCDH
ncbi:MAG: hypothetical protein M1490_02095 [Candidatus Bathyarchaeota archaeon]|nr:hypothetical protein [Candidatus Bathyarchaeota archaeon]